MDRLAARGVLFTQAYVTAPVCSPSRAGWTTGRHQVRWDPKSSFGCGLPGNVNRMLGGPVDAVIDTSTWERPRVFAELQALGDVADDEMLRTFNCGVGMVLAVPASEVDTVLATASESRAAVLIIDSMQTMSVDDVGSAPGSVTQLRESVGRIVRFAKQNEVAVFVIGHVTKEGAIAGPRVVEHMVDTVLYFENDPSSRYSLIRSVKNRFGASAEMGVFAMTERGFREVTNPSAIFLSSETHAEPGSIVSVAWEGSRPLLVEVQALVADSGGSPRRLAQGVDQNRLALLLAVLTRHGDTELAGEDVFVNIVGGLRINETAVDLPTVLAIVSSFRNRTLGEKLISFGELGLAGEVRPVRFGTERIQAAAKQGFTRCIVPYANRPRTTVDGIEVHGVRRLREALELAFES